MTRYYKRQLQRGAILVRIGSYSVQGVALMATAHHDESDRFATKGSRIALVRSRKQVQRFGRPEVEVTAAMRAVIAEPWLHHVRRDYRVARTQAMLDLPAQEWEWRRRGALLDRLEMAWTVAESLGDTATLERLKAWEPLGQLPDLFYEPLSGDDAYREALKDLDLERARRDFSEISRQQDGQFTVLN